jgi:hypothetical protein
MGLVPVTSGFCAACKASQPEGGEGGLNGAVGLDARLRG